MDVMGFLNRFILVVDATSLFFVITVGCVYLIQLVSALLGLMQLVRERQYSDHARFLTSENTIPMTVIVPAYNEEAGVVGTVKNLLQLNFPQYEIIVVNDGSKDATLRLLIEAFSMVRVRQPIKSSIRTKRVQAVYRSPCFPTLTVIDKANGGKADALNCGINASRYPIFVSIDADSMLEKDALIKLAMPFVRDHRVVGVGGIVRIAGETTVKDGKIKKVDLSGKPLVNLQTIEYLRAFLTGRIGFDQLDILMIVSGAFGAFSKQTVIEAGGYTVGTIGEDMELVVKLHRHLREQKRPYRIKFLADPVCWTEPPSRLKDLRAQRKRWQIGLVSVLGLHRKLLFNPKYGRVGLAAIPYFWLIEMIGPFLEFIGYVSIPIAFLLGFANVNFFIGFYAVSVLYGIVLTIGALIMEENSFQKYPTMKQLVKLLGYAVLDNFGYRQVNNFYRIEGMVTYWKNKNTWGSIKREGLDGSAGRAGVGSLGGAGRVGVESLGGAGRVGVEPGGAAAMQRLTPPPGRR